MGAPEDQTGSVSPDPGVFHDVSCMKRAECQAGCQAMRYALIEQGVGNARPGAARPSTLAPGSRSDGDDLPDVGGPRPVPAAAGAAPGDEDVVACRVSVQVVRALGAEGGHRRRAREVAASALVAARRRSVYPGLRGLDRRARWPWRTAAHAPPLGGPAGASCAGVDGPSAACAPSARRGGGGGPRSGQAVDRGRMVGSARREVGWMNTSCA